MSAYPYTPGFAPVNTSERAAESVERDAETMRQRIAAWLWAQPTGATCEEIERSLDLRHQTASARLREMELIGVITKTTEQRKNESGRSARVYRPASVQMELL